MTSQAISVVIPVFNEEENVVLAHRELSAVLSKMNREYELIFIDDGSKDLTLKRLQEAAADDPNMVVIEFRRNFGQTAALAAGLDAARFPIVITMDGDLQNDPAEIPRLVNTLEQGYDLVAGWRKERRDKFISRKLPSMLANRIISWSTGVYLHDYGCTLKAMTSEIAKGLKLYGEMHRFIPALAHQLGARMVELPVNHRERRYGNSKYGISRTIRVLLDLITVKFLLGYSKRPIHLFGGLGIAASFLGTVLIALMTYQRFIDRVPMGNRPLLALAVMLVVIGLQFLVFGLLAEVLARTYYESQDKRVYVIRRIFVGNNEILPEHGAKKSSENVIRDYGDQVWGQRAVN